MKESILVIGTGEVGLAMLKSLYDYKKTNSKEIQLGVLVNPASAYRKEILKPFAGINIESIDLVGNSTEELCTVFKKYDTVICCSGFVIGKGIQVKVTEAVLQAGVRRYVPWQYGIDYDRMGRGSGQPAFDEQLDVRDLLRAQNQTHWVVVSTGMITSFLFREDFGVIDLSHKTVHALGAWEHSLTLTTCEDIGDLTTKILFHEPKILDEVVFVAGDTVTFTEIADKMDAFYQTRFKRVLWNIPYLENELKKNPEDVMTRYRLVFTKPAVTWPLETTFNYKNNIPTEGIAEWAERHIVK